MQIIIMGSGRTGSYLATMLAQASHDVTVIDWTQDAFSRLGDDFPGRAILGNAIDIDVLRQAGIESADAFVAATSGDNRNIMASQIAQKVFHVPKVVSRIKDPNRAGLYAELGIQCDCRTLQQADQIRMMIEEVAQVG